MSNASTKQKPKPKTAPKPKAAQRGPREGSTMWAAMEVLRGKRNPMTTGEIYAEIRERKLAPGLKGKTPEQTLAAQLAVNAKRGRYVERTEPASSGSSAEDDRLGPHAVALGAKTCEVGLGRWFA